jgi:hypothetical protein
MSTMVRGGAGAQLFIVWYSFTGVIGNPGTLVYSSGLMDASVAGEIRASVPFTFPAGTYYVGILAVTDIDQPPAGGPGTTGLLTPLLIPGWSIPGGKLISDSGLTTPPTTTPGVYPNGGVGVHNAPNLSCVIG